jgi:UDP-GlcNAc:undecaprenyl-phosphate GlcNAc-1-phosphate transferase
LILSDLLLLHYRIDLFLKTQTLLTLVASFSALSLLVNLIYLRLTKSGTGINTVAPDQLRWSNKRKPAIGGLSFFVTFLASLLTYLIFFQSDLDLGRNLKLVGIFLATSLGFVAGLLDDKYVLSPKIKLGTQIVTGLVLVSFGIHIELFDAFWLNSIVTIIWVLAVMNSINMLDNMDGVATIASIFILLTLIIVQSTLPEPDTMLVAICGGVLAALIGFLFLNWNPSKIFMGDSGSQMIGAFLATASIMTFWNVESLSLTHTWYSNGLVVLTVFIIPFADTLTVIINRVSSGRSPFEGGRDHTTHHMSFAGLSDKQVAYVIILISSLSLSLVYLLTVMKISMTQDLIFCLYALAVFGFLYSTTKHFRVGRLF